ncbi:hypothetical protein Q5752_002306 [Cryptotrichosporon argae]
MADVQAFDDLLGRTVKNARLSGSKVKELTDLSLKLLSHDTHLAASLLSLNNALAPASAHRVNLLYVLDSIARAARAHKESGVRVGAGLLVKLESVAESVVGGLVDDGAGGVWAEGREKARKVLGIWEKGTFPEHCLASLRARIQGGAASGTPPVFSPSLGGPGRSTTPPSLPPPHVLDAYAYAKPPSAHASAHASPAPEPGPAPAHAPGQLPAAIMALLGGPVAPASAPAPAPAPELPAPDPAIAKLLASVRPGPAALPAPTHAPTQTQTQTHTQTPPAPAPPAIDMAQLAALAQTLVPSTFAPAPPPPQQPAPHTHARPPFPPRNGQAGAFSPPPTHGLNQHSQHNQHNQHNQHQYGEYGQHGQQGSNQPGRSLAPPQLHARPPFSPPHAGPSYQPFQAGSAPGRPRPAHARTGSSDWDREGRGGGREREWERADRPDSRDGRDHRDGRDGRERETVTRDRDRRDVPRRSRSPDRRAVHGHSHGPPPSASPTVPASVRATLPPKPTRAALPADRAAAWDDGPTPGLAPVLGPVLGHGLPSRPAVPSDGGMHGQQHGLPGQPPSRARPASTPAPAPAPVSAPVRPLHNPAGPQPTPPLTLATFDHAAFNPADPASWARLGAAWTASTGRAPSQLEVMRFLATGEVEGAGGAGDTQSMGGMGGMSGAQIGGMGGAESLGGMGGAAQGQGMGQGMGMGMGHAPADFATMGAMGGGGQQGQQGQKGANGYGGFGAGMGMGGGGAGMRY